MSDAPSSCLPTQKHNVVQPSRSHLRVFAPKDLSVNRRVDSQYGCAYAYSWTANGYTIVTILVKKTDYFCTVTAGGKCQVVQGNITEVSEQPPTVTGSQHPFENVECLFQQLEGFANGCSTCQLIYYDLPVKGLLHYDANNSASALSAVLIKIDEQQVGVQPCTMLTAFLAATLRCQQSGLPDTAVCGGMHLLGNWFLMSNQLIAHGFQVKQD